MPALTRGSVVAVAVVLMGSLGLGQTAEAQHCGWYVVRAGDEALQRALGLQFELESAPAPVDAPRQPAPAPEPPSDGPGCSKAPAAPSSNPAPPPPPGVEHWALARESCPTAAPASHLWPESDGPLLLAPRLGGLFHPPRSC